MTSNNLALQCGIRFVTEYYGKLSRTPGDLEGMYSQRDSVLTLKEDGELIGPLCGTQAIREHILQWTGKMTERRFNISSIEAQPSVSDSFLLIVNGTVLTRDSARSFTHVFVLGKNHKNQGYYIHNDALELRDVTAVRPAQEEPRQSPRAASPCRQPAAEEPRVHEQPAQSPPASPKKEEAPQPVVEETPVQEEPDDEHHVAAEAVAAEPEAQEEQVEEEQAEEEPAAAEEQQPEPEPEVVEEPVKEAEPEPEPAAAAAPAAAEPAPAQPEPEPSSWADLANRGKAAPQRKVQTNQKVTGGKAPQYSYETPAAARGTDSGKGAGGRGRGAGPPREPRPAAPRETPSKYQYPALYVNRFPASLREEDIREIFSKFGKIMSCHFQKDAQKCFIDFADRTAIDAALAEKIVFQGQQLNVQERKSPEERRRERDEETARRGTAAPRRGAGRASPTGN